jgi:lysophospholipase L1-like esterase
MDGNVPDGAVVFIGDSITQGLCVSAVVPSSVNYGIGNDTTIGVLQRLPKYKSIARASAVVIAIGINDMKFRSNEEILRNYSAIVCQMPENVPAIFSALLPLDEDVREEWQGRNQKRIQPLNNELEVFTRKSKNLFFVNAGPHLVDAHGNLADKFHDGDGVHLNQKGYAIWIKELQKIIEAATSRCTIPCD